MGQKGPTIPVVLLEIAIPAKGSNVITLFLYFCWHFQCKVTCAYMLLAIQTNAAIY